MESGSGARRVPDRETGALQTGWPGSGARRVPDRATEGGSTQAGDGTWPRWSAGRPTELCGVDLGAQRGDVREVAVALGVVEAVADDELVGDLEADVLHRHLDLHRVGLAQQGADLETRRLPPA